MRGVVTDRIVPSSVVNVRVNLWPFASNGFVVENTVTGEETGYPLFIYVFTVSSVLPSDGLKVYHLLILKTLFNEVLAGIPLYTESLVI